MKGIGKVIILGSLVLGVIGCYVFIKCSEKESFE